MFDWLDPCTCDASIQKIEHRMGNILQESLQCPLVFAGLSLAGMDLFPFAGENAGETARNDTNMCPAESGGS
jgi:hypothetical protein